MYNDILNSHQNFYNMTCLWAISNVEMGRFEIFGRKNVKTINTTTQK